MNAAEHAARAEKLINGDALEVAAAQVHATLALAASVELIAHQFYGSSTGSLPVEVVGR